MTLIPVYKTGIHSGEERIVAGNDRSGMVFFSGCHLSCNFCYTPETSVHKLGDALTASQFQSRLESLISDGAKNLNLISPTHVWSAVEGPLKNIRETYPGIPIVLKTSGYETPAMIARMAQVADVFVPDFKVFAVDLAKSVGLPPNYGVVARNAIEAMMQTPATILVRHLLMPKATQDSHAIISELSSINFNGYLNLMTHFIRPTGGFATAATQDVEALLERATASGIKVLINGSIAKVSYVA